MALIVEPDQYTEGVPVVIIWRADLFVVFFWLQSKNNIVL